MEIYNLIQKIKDEADKLEPSRKEHLLDMIDSFYASVHHLLDPKGEEGDEDQARETKDLDEKERFSRMEDRALSDMAERNFD